jgi:hypothetical protein
VIERAVLLLVCVSAFFDFYLLNKFTMGALWCLEKYGRFFAVRISGNGHLSQTRCAPKRVFFFFVNRVPALHPPP